MGQRRFTHRQVLGLALAVILALALCVCGACASTAEQGPAPDDNGTTVDSPTPADDDTDDVEPEIIDADPPDMLYTTSVTDEELDVVVYDDIAILIPSGERLNCNLDEEAQSGHFYHVVADVDYLSGGIAGYYMYPDVKRVKSVKEVSPDDLDIPTIEEHPWGVARIGDYANADFLLCEYRRYAVLSGRKWIYRYDKLLTRDDGSRVCYRADVDQADIEAGIAKGVILCKDYFLMPAIPIKGSS